jgi:hypothetical protein
LKDAKLKFATLVDGVPNWWPSLDEAQQAATELFAQNIKCADAVHVFAENDFMNPVWTISRKGDCGPRAGFPYGGSADNS